ncbi:unnamed protein product [Didymodactylos carnosus]|uniref:GST N-terminal domain-containing protein n=1 Tax=Didymodactylos carnosus TaxID=1234261 RepID=A0A814HUM4_9BILA|nr:unnamed protein product [Didymodactylos carnosus]CAF1285730.1 unnamed protein product [Didymodactylos carnosus]CAF3784854.1 unnamed protein product [Didymodactylos carnosus]CAF4090714.1 unnamed protein product [Didymodactylos carnosus]
MQPLRLYVVSISHYCDKIRWALDFKSLPYEKIEFNPRKPPPDLKRAPKTMKKLVPILEDPNNNDLFICDSTHILIYLEEQYPQTKNLFPLNNNRQRIIDFCLKLDSTFGLYTRRLAYLQLIGEQSSKLAMVFGGKKFAWASNPHDIRSYLFGYVFSCFVISRYRIHRVKEDGIYEKTKQLLDDIIHDLGQKQYLFNNEFTAADLTFCSLLKPLTVVTSIVQNPKYHSLFAYDSRIRQTYDANGKLTTDPVVEKLLQPLPSNRKRGTTSWLLKPIYLIQFLFISLMTILVGYFYGMDSDEPPQFKVDESNPSMTVVNDQRLIKLTSKLQIIPFFIRYLSHLFITIPLQLQHINSENKIK